MGQYLTQFFVISFSPNARRVRISDRQGAVIRETTQPHIF